MRAARFTVNPRIFTIACVCLLASAMFADRHAAADMAISAPEKITLGGILHADSDDTLAFTRDGKIVFFDRSNGPRKTIMISHRVNGHWSPPQIAGFSGHWFDQDPVVSPDGSYLLFDSDRPVMPGGKPLVQNYFGNHKQAPGSNIWKVERDGDGWSQPVWLGPVVNNDVFVDFASIAADGSLYFIRRDRQEGIMHTYRSAYRDGKYLPPVRAGLGDPAVSTHDPAVAPDQSFIVFDYGKVKGGLGRLCIAFREGDHWSKPMDLGDAVNSDIPWGSHIAPDGRSVYFTGQTGIWHLSLAPWLDAHRAPE
ncbi:MAG TPA: hypothetical protein VGK80_00970 [Rhodanobacteraceae bacterium]